MADIENENRRKHDAAEYSLPPVSHLQENENRILDYLENQMPDSERRAVEAHLAVCPECGAFGQQLKQLDAALAHDLARPELSSEFTAHLWQRIETETRPVPVPLRAQLKQQLEEEFQARSTQLRKNFLLLPEVLEGIGYAAVAAVAAYFLVQLLAGVFSAQLTTTTWPGANPALFFAYATGAICLLVGAGFALKRQAVRWLAMF